MKLNIQDIINILPHSYPFLLVDKVIECIPEQSSIAIKNVSFNEPFFLGHFPGNPVMPGVLIVEAMAQNSAICILSSLVKIEKKEKLSASVYLTSVESAKFRRVVIPGDTLTISCKLLAKRQGFYKFSCSCHVEKELAAECIITAKG